ncbi:MAG TPA: hypothetical protein VLA72_09040 [Anaerolineales bacterium]|nr:hypothetical protein [Anaerolineales bacterium]
MKLSTLMIIKAVIVIFFGIGFILMPTTVMSLFGLTLNPGGALITQLYGASFILLGILMWSARNASGSEAALRAIVLAAFIGDTIGFIVALIAQLAGVANALGWLTVVLYLFLAMGFGYFQFSKSNS